MANSQDIMMEWERAGPSHKLIKRASSNKLVVFFSGTDKSNGSFDFFKSANIINHNVLLINNGINAWYQSGIPGFSFSLSDTADKISRCAEQLDCDEIITVGVSMGGYGAILIGSILDTRVLAFSFDTVLRHPLSRSAKRMPKNIMPHYKQLRPIIINSKCKITALCGEMDFSDLLSLSRISDLKNVEAYSVRGVSHGVGRFLDKKYDFSTILSYFIDNKKLPIIKECNSLCNDKAQSKMIFQAHQAYLNKDFLLASELAESILLKDQLSEPALFILGLANIGLKKYKNAVENFSFVAGMSPHFTTAKFNLAKSLRMAKKYSQSIHHFYEYIDIVPSSAGAYYNLSLIFEKLDLPSESKHMAQKACDLSPDNDVYKNRCLAICS